MALLALLLVSCIASSSGALEPAKPGQRCSPVGGSGYPPQHCVEGAACDLTDPERPEEGGVCIRKETEGGRSIRGGTSKREQCDQLADGYRVDKIDRSSLGTILSSCHGKGWCNTECLEMRDQYLTGFIFQECEGEHGRWAGENLGPEPKLFSERAETLAEWWGASNGTEPLELADQARNRAVATSFRNAIRDVGCSQNSKDASYPWMEEVHGENCLYYIERLETVSLALIDGYQGKYGMSQGDSCAWLERMGCCAASVVNASATIATLALSENTPSLNSSASLLPFPAPSGGDSVLQTVSNVCSLSFNRTIAKSGCTKAATLPHIQGEVNDEEEDSGARQREEYPGQDSFASERQANSGAVYSEQNARRAQQGYIGHSSEPRNGKDTAPTVGGYSQETQRGANEGDSQGMGQGGAFPWAPKESEALSSRQKSEPEQGNTADDEESIAARWPPNWRDNDDDGDDLASERQQRRKDEGTNNNRGSTPEVPEEEGEQGSKEIPQQGAPSPSEAAPLPERREGTSRKEAAGSRQKRGFQGVRESQSKDAVSATVAAFVVSVVCLVFGVLGYTYCISPRLKRGH